jgi:protein-tyrosine kinase
MSRIQDILSKAERDGTARRTRALGDEYATPPADEGVSTRGYVQSAPAARTLDDNQARPAAPEAPRGFRPRRAGAAALPDTAPSGSTEAPPVPVSGRSAAYEATPRLMAQLDPHLVAALAPTSLAAEQYRSLRTRIRRSESGRGLRTIAITSPNKGDGKSLTAANLALTMAQEFQQRVLLLDCDLRRPSVHHLFGLAEAPGLGDVLMNAAELEQALVLLPEYHLTVLPAGLPPSNPAELIGSAAMRRVLDTLRTRFDRILIDVPPVAPLADLHILAPMVDALLMIVRAGVTPKPAIERALAGLDPNKVLGLVFNESGSQSEAYSTYEGYGYIAG